MYIFFKDLLHRKYVQHFERQCTKNIYCTEFCNIFFIHLICVCWFWLPCSMHGYGLFKKKRVLYVNVKKF